MAQKFREEKLINLIVNLINLDEETGGFRGRKQ